MTGGLAALGALDRLGKALRPYADRLARLRVELFVAGLGLVLDLIWQWLRGREA